MATFTDNFNRADSANLGANWTNDSTFSGLGISSNQAYNPASSNNFTIAWVATGTATFTADHSAQVICSVVGASELPGPAVRCANANYYYVHCSSTSANSEVVKSVAGAHTVIREMATTFANGDTCKLEVTGTTLKVYKNGAQVGTDISDSDLASGQPGFKIYSVAGTARVDDFDAADLGGSTTRGIPFGNEGTAFAGGRILTGLLRRQRLACA